MSGAVRQVKKLFDGGGDSQARPKQQAQEEKPVPRVATAEERALGLRRRRGSRSLLSQERIDAEAGLAGDQTTLGGM